MDDSYMIGKMNTFTLLQTWQTSQVKKTATVLQLTWPF